MTARDNKSRLHLVKSDPEMTGRIFHTGDMVPESGIYLVLHPEHRLPHEVTLLRDQQFPTCAKCANAVVFQLVQAAPHLHDGEFRVALHRIPELPEEEASTGASELAS
jgi:hypothetical protein